MRRRVEWGGLVARPFLLGFLDLVFFGRGKHGRGGKCGKGFGLGILDFGWGGLGEVVVLWLI